jgi:hypothetical protein
MALRSGRPLSRGFIRPPCAVKVGRLSSMSERVSAIGATSTCRTCEKPIEYGPVTQPGGYLARIGWSDGSPRDGLICFRALHYAHVPDD